MEGNFDESSDKSYQIPLDASLLIVIAVAKKRVRHFFVPHPIVFLQSLSEGRLFRYYLFQPLHRGPCCHSDSRNRCRSSSPSSWLMDDTSPQSVRWPSLSSRSRTLLRCWWHRSSRS